METTDILLIALVVFVPAALMWAVFVARTGKPGGRGRVTLGIPQAMRPAPPDEKLEGPRLERMQWAGFVATIILAGFIVAYWLPEKNRQEHFAERFDEESVHRGQLTYQAPPPLPEGVGAAEYKELEEGIALGQACSNCHGGQGEGGSVEWADADGTEVRYQAPPLNNVFTRWDEEVVRFTIERGRPGTDMPTWGVEYGGSMTSQMVDDVMAWLKTLPGNQEPPAQLAEACKPGEPASADCSTGKQIFEARCAVCHGPQGQGKEEESNDGDPKTLPAWYPGAALWKGDVKHLSEEAHLSTIRNGRRFAFMPAFAEAPVQGIPVPNYPLTEAQIRAVMEYERTL